ncbi:MULTISPECIES: sensor histidine kinase [Paenibacillus]|uniref:histidine kinase n=2 Tax=Paenibacillus lactis TaxID=228574 RepID=G4H9L7_9BACL|nr:sensor histidine kinase [Paenibacillus lactis]EHB68552.1 integral membrane sensor signal transduction histidine kinase [Paenibacillus lactis 154]MBP1893417.1 two-component system sensor histidine kinase YesM [Paenibacillus lactis]GIO91038.1 sensor histidine kinase [Paenibacillus lactis]HAG01335.1 sensor histidine kinase [Paenibacillus lactis]
MKKRFRFRSFINDIPLNYKFILIYVIGVLLPIAVINIAFMDRMTGIIKDREEQNLQISLERARKDIHEFIDGGVAVSHALNTDKLLYETLDRTYESPIQFYETFDEQLRNRVTSYIPVNNQIQRISIFTENDTIMPGGNYQVLDANAKNSDWYRLWEQSTSPVMVAAYRATEANNRTATVPYLSVIEKMDYFDIYSKYDKLLRIDIDLNKIYDVILREQDYLNLYLVNEHNQIIMSADSGYQRDVTDAYPVFQLADHDKDKDVHVVSIGTASYVKGWKLVGVTQGTRLSQAMREMQLYVGMIAAVITLFSFIFIYIMLRSYNYRVKRLSRHMQKVTNEKFDLIRMDEGRDEIGGLIQNFNRMTAEINSLINNVYKLEIQKKNLEMERVRAELNFLQSQMNPHFLFNTLNAILVVCTKNNYSDVTDIIKNLSRLLRRLLSWKADIVTLEEEILFIEMYLKIEKFRFRDKIEYELDIDREALLYKIPKMSIQPLVENACKHGIQAVDGKGVVKISATVIDGNLRVSVQDNGKGMVPEKLREVLISMRNENTSGTSIGIRNVYCRLELYYNDLVRFDIYSKPDQGTTVFFEIPVSLLDHQDYEQGGERN